MWFHWSSKKCRRSKLPAFQLTNALLYTAYVWHECIPRKHLNDIDKNLNWQLCTNLLGNIGFFLLREKASMPLLVKVSKSRKQILKFSFEQKNEQFFFCISALEKRGQIKKKRALYNTDWRILFWLSYTTFLIWTIFIG